jgi:BRCT domain type II-containing protein
MRKGILDEVSGAFGRWHHVACWNAAGIVVRPPTPPSATPATFAFPRIGASGVADALKGARIVLTGTFPDLGGVGVGMRLGKDVLKEHLELYGATVTSALSKKTAFLVVGCDPGPSKVAAARAAECCAVVDLDGVVALMRGVPPHEVPTPSVDAFCPGYAAVAESRKRSLDDATFSTPEGPPKRVAASETPNRVLASVGGNTGFAALE